VLQIRDAGLGFLAASDIDRDFVVKTPAPAFVPHNPPQMASVSSLQRTMADVGPIICGNMSFARMATARRVSNKSWIRIFIVPFFLFQKIPFAPLVCPSPAAVNY